MSGGGSSNSKYANSVFYATSYHPIQAGSIDGTDILPHDNAVYRAVLCSSAGLYDPFGDPKLIGDDPYRTLFVGHLSHFTTEDTLRQAMSKYGSVKNLRLIRHIVTGASRGYAFVEYESEREMLRAYEDAHHSIIDDCEIIVDYNRQQLMSGWIPRRLGGGIGGKKESGQLRFGGRERPFRAPLRPIPFDDLKRLGIPPPPEGRYLMRHQVPSPPRRRRSSLDMDEPSYLHKRSKHSHRYERRSSSSEDHVSDSKRSHQHESRKSNSEDHPSDSKHSQRYGRRMSSTKDYPSASKHSHQHERRRSRSKDHLSSDSKHSHRYERRRSSGETSDSKYSDRHEQRRSINEDHPSASKHSKRHERRRSSTKDHPSDSRHSHQHERRRPSSKDQASDSKDSHQHERRRSTSEDHSSD